jgi:uncharacterized membrane protein YcaP (DUF421 family)
VTAVDLLVVVGQSLAIYVFLVVALGRLGRDQMAGLTPFGYLVIALLGSAVETGLYHGSSSLAAGLVAAATLLLADHATTFLVNRWPRLRRWLCGAPVVLAHDGRVIPEHLRRVRLTEEDLRAAIRERGYEDLADVRLAVLEVDGSVGVVPKDKDGPSRE